jgi:hypothetical protein
LGCGISENSKPYLDKAWNFQNASPKIFGFSVQELFKLGITSNPLAGGGSGRPKPLISEAYSPNSLSSSMDVREYEENRN